MNHNVTPPTDSTDKRQADTPTPAPRGPNLVSAMLGLLTWTLVGATAGFCMIQSSAFLGRYEWLGALIHILTLPAIAMVYIWGSLGLGPHGDEGFVLYMIFPVVEWALIGFLVGAGRLWYQRKKALHPAANTSVSTWKPKRALFAVLVFMLLVGGYFIHRETAIAKDREFCLKQVNHQELAEACLQVLVDPDKHGVMIGASRGDNPNLPEGIRKLKPSKLAYHGWEMSVHRIGFFQGLSLSHNFTNAQRYDLTFLRNGEEPVLLYSLYSTNQPKTDWH